MTIAIDFDGTWTLDPWFWSNFADSCFDVGHQLFLVTRRRPDEPIDRIANYLHHTPVQFIYCSGEFKRVHCESVGIKIDIWIDDEPGTIEPQRLLNSSPDCAL